jgi:phosphoglucomutase
MNRTQAITKKISPLAGKPAPLKLLVDVPKLITAYYTEVPDPAIREQRVLFGTSGHRGSSLDTTFNEGHILAITQAICWYRAHHKIDGPLFLGIDTHALSIPAYATALEVLAANGVEIMIAEQDAYTPTPAISHAILRYNRGRSSGLADGIVITPSHNPPRDGGFKYNPPHGGPAATGVTHSIENKANTLLENKLKGVKRISLQQALRATTTHYYDYLHSYVNDLGAVIAMDIIRGADIRVAVDPLGGAGVHYWLPLADRYGLNLTVVNPAVDPTFRFMTVDADGQIRMDPASPYAMVNLIGLKDRFDIAFACDTDHDRHGIVTPKSGLLPANHYLAIAISYLFKQRRQWQQTKAVGKTIVSSQMIDWISAKRGVSLYEVPVGFKWFVDGLIDGALGFCGEESAGATFNCFDGSVWTTDKDGIVPALLAAEITASQGCDLSEIYHGLEEEFCQTFYERIDADATPQQKEILKKLSPQQIKVTELAGEKIEAILTTAPGDGGAIEGIKISTQGGWIAARPSGTEAVYKIYAESFRDADHLQRLLQEAQMTVNDALENAS